MRVLLYLTTLAMCRAQLLVLPQVDEKTLKYMLTVGQEQVNVSLTISEPTICDKTVKQYSGYFQTSKDASDGRSLFFWLMESRRAPSTDPLVMWLTGGPGCSSMLALIAENGPCSVMGKATEPSHNPSSWNTQANVIWVDQPAGTGFSVGSNPGHMYESTVGDEMYGFLQVFFQHFTEYQNRDFFVTGESYGGHFVPSVSHRIWQGNEKKEGLHIPLKGLAVGNGLTDPLEQYNWYPEMAYNGGKSVGGTAPGVIDEDTYEQMKAAVPACIEKIAKCRDESTYDACNEAQGYCNGELLGPYQETGMNSYDQRIKCEVPGLCYDFSGATNWLNSDTVQKELGVTKRWESCNYGVNRQFSGDWMVRYDLLIPDMLASGIRVLIYSGDCDFVCNWLGNKAWTLKLPWSHKDEFNAAGDKSFTLNEKEVGRLRSANGFSFMQVYQAGHMVPMDQPEVALKMINGFITNSLDEASDEMVV